MKKIQVISLIVLTGSLAGFSFLAYKLQSHVTPKKQISVTILHGVRNPGTKFFNYGTKWRQIFADFDVIHGYDTSQYEYELEVTSDQKISLKPAEKKSTLNKITLKALEKIITNKKIATKLHAFLKESKNKQITWKEIEWALHLDSATLKILQKNFILD
ncbi:MAG0490 family ComEA-like DNA-binding protein [Mesomycoplasma ovipneumoniae]|uniref:MAG0490 family ComEA-like DNA-binding protein n=1 Tax=Mesomycoplasma ovipneumoniae TaxID=29562 RepID=UPI00311B3AC0